MVAVRILAVHWVRDVECMLTAGRNTGLPDSHQLCPKCAVLMGEGFLLDVGHYSSKKVLEWYEGVPEESFWANGLKTSGRQHFQIRSYRCPQCGYLESYAGSSGRK